MPPMTTISKDLWRRLAMHREATPWVSGKHICYCRGEALAIAHALADALACKQGERVGLCLRGPMATIVVLLALWLRGAVAVLIHPAFPEQRRKELLLETGCQRCLDDGFFSDPLIGDILKKGRSRGTSAPYPDFAENVWAAMLFTSGSTGAPKAVVLSLGNLFYNALGTNRALALGFDDRWLLSLPLFHVGGLGIVVRTLLAGASVVIPHVRGDVESGLRTEGLTHLSLVPTQLYRLLRDGQNVEKLSALKRILVGGEALSPGLLHEIREKRLPVYATYGCTEMASHVVSYPVSTSNAATTPITLPYAELKLAVDGEIRVRGRTRFLGYWTQKGLQRPFDENGWFATGDLGRWQEGRLAVYGRKDAMFISGGENVHPQTIEHVLLNHPGIERAVVVPVDDVEFGARPVAFIDSLSHAPAVWDAELRKHLAGFQVPDVFLPWPKHATDALKPDRQALSISAQSLFDQWARWRFLRNWLKNYPPGWKLPLSIGEHYVFQLIDHKHRPHHHKATPRHIFALARSREQVLRWLLDGVGRSLLTPDSSREAWSAEALALQHSVHEGMEIIHLVSDDTYPHNLTAFDATLTDTLQKRELTFVSEPSQRERYLTIVAHQEPFAYALCLGADTTLPANDKSAPILQLGVYLPDTQRSYVVRCFYENSRCPDGFLSWRVQALREANGMERDQPFWYVEESEVSKLEALIRQQGLLSETY